LAIASRSTARKAGTELGKVRLRRTRGDLCQPLAVALLPVLADLLGILQHVFVLGLDFGVM
jgi:hypothetical protein